MTSSPTSLTQHDRRLSLVFAVTLLAYAAVAIGFYLFSDFRQVLESVPDDVFYFLKTAQSMAQGRGMTFDGIDPTNGFQPLWLFALVPIYWIHSGEPEAMTRAMLILQVLTLTGIGWLLHVTLRRVLSAAAATIFGLAYVFAIVAPGANGMESTMLIGALALLFVFVLNAQPFTRYSALPSLVTGVLLGLVFLARLDHVFLPLLIFMVGGVLFLFHGERRREHFWRYLLMGVGFAAVILPYLIHNALYFDGIMPMSGKLKSTFPHIALAPKTLKKLGVAQTSIAVAALLYIVNYFRTRRAAITPPEHTLRAGMAFLGAAIIVHYLHTALFMQWGVFGWHFIAYNLFLCVLLGDLAWRYRALLAPKLLWAALFVMISAGAAWTASTGLEHEYNAASYDAAQWAKQNTPADAIFAQKDTGTFGYFSERRTINLDGLVNNVNYQDTLRSGMLHEYFANRGVDYLIFHAFSAYPKVAGDYSAFPLAYWSYMYKVNSDTLYFARRHEVFRTREYLDGATTRPYMLCVWDLPRVLSEQDSLRAPTH